jgi:ABC-type transport system substrate-binding protein
MNKANAEPDPKVAANLFNDAQKVLGQDMPDVPLYFNKSAGVWSSNTNGVVVTGFAWPNLLEVYKTG